MERSSPAVVFGVFALVLVMVVLYSFSRGAIMLMAGFLAVVVGVAGVRSFTSRDTDRSPLITVVLSLLFLGFLGLGLASLKTGGLIDRLETLSKGVEDVSAKSRLVAAQATWEMAQDNLVTGWGAGSFRFYFPVYQVRYPEITMNDERRVLWEHAHDDYLELLAEVGAIGCGILAAGFLLYLARLSRLRVWRHPAAILLLGSLVTMIHATFDFPFFNPAILITWCALWPVMLRWLEIEQPRGRAEPSPSAG
jgi:O-antigen ligase